MAYNDMGNFDEIKETIDGWSVQPVNKDQVEPMALAKMTSGYAIEQYQWNTYHSLIEMTQDKQLQELFAQLALWEENHQSLMGSLVDPSITPMEQSLALEMTAIMGFADAAQLETDENAKTAYDYMLLDHLTQTNAIAQTASSEGINPENVLKGKLQAREGRPFDKQIVPSSDLFKNRLNKNTADVTSFVYLHTLIANEEWLRSSFQVMRTMLPSQETRRLFNMVTVVENIHVTMLESLHDPTLSPLEHAMVNELMEIRNHRLGMDMAKTDSARSAHEFAMKGDEIHLNLLREAYSNIEKGDASRFSITDKLFMQPPMSANDYVNQVLQTQINLVARGTGFEMAA